MNRAAPAEYPRTRRVALRPQDVGLPRVRPRRTQGLRREEVAVLSDMSIDYYSHLEQPRGPHPSEQILGALARGLRYCGPVRLVHPEVGLLELHCQRLIDPDLSQQLVVYTAEPGSESQEKLQLLNVIGSPGLAGSYR